MAIKLIYSFNKDERFIRVKAILKAYFLYPYRNVCDDGVCVSLIEPVDCTGCPSNKKKI